MTGIVLPLKDKIFFAVGGFGENVTFQAITAWLFFFWSGQGDASRAFIGVGTLGLLLGIGRFIEAFDDPLIGYLSDRTKSPCGRRFPYIFFGAPFVALSFWLLWNPPQEGQTVLNAAYFFAVLQVFYLSYTLVSAPYEGMLPEIARTSEERVSVSGWRVLFGVMGAGAGLVGSSMLIGRFGFSAMGAILGLAGMLAFWTVVVGLRRKFSGGAAPPAELSIHKAAAATLKNREFLIFSIAFVCFSLGLNLLTALLPFYVTVILKAHIGSVAFFTAILLASMLLFLPVHAAVAKRKGKNWTYAVSMLLLGGMFLLLAFVGTVPAVVAFWQLVALVAFIGAALAGQFIFPNAILADVIDYDASRTGFRREAMYYGMQNTLQKFSFALSAAILGGTLAFFGASEADALGIRLIGPIAAVAAFAGWLIFRKWYTLPG